MKIAVWHNLPSGGAKRALYYHVRGLVERGHQVECWTLSSADRSYLPLSELAPEHVIPLDWQPVEPRIGRSFALYPNTVSCRRAVDKASKRCARQINEDGFDVVFANSCRYFLMPSIVRFLRRPTVLYLQEPNRYLYEARPVLPWIGALRGSQEPLRSYLRNALVQLLLLPILRMNARDEWRSAHACKTILANSYYSCESIVRAYGRDAQVCYLGIDTDLFRNLKKERERFIVGVSAFDRAKAIELAIRSVSLLPQPRPPLLWIANAGEKAYIDELSRLAADLRVDLHVKMGISDTELVAILNRAALMLYTSRLEPFGLAPLEANACGTPVVSVAEGGVRETIKDGINGYLVERDAGAIAQAAAALLDDPALARRIGESAAAYVRQEWSLERGIDHLESYLLGAAGTSKHLRPRVSVSSPQDRA